MKEHFFITGFTHVIPWGYDHLLFIICLFFVQKSFKDLSLLSLSFTLAHSITLAAGYFKLILVPPPVTEPLIALSIVVLAYLRMKEGPSFKFPFITVFLFGLLHGSGFAGALSAELDRGYSWFAPLLLFNLGIEAAQFFILAFMYILFHEVMKKNEQEMQTITKIICGLCAAAGMFLFVSRLIETFSE